MTHFYARKWKLGFLFWAILVCCQMVNGQIITTVAGNASATIPTGDGGAATAAYLKEPFALTLDATGNIYVADVTNFTIRKIDVSTGYISKYVGSGIPGYSGDGGAATAATIAGSYGLLFDASGNMYFSDAGNGVIRKVAASTGIITTVAGNGVHTYSGDGGAATAASLSHPRRIALDASGNLLIADRDNHRVRKLTISTGIISTIAGNGVQGYSGNGSLATNASLNFPSDVAVDAAGNMYIADAGNHVIRKVAAGTGIISTIAGNGTPTFSGDGGAATIASLYNPQALTLDASGNIYIADAENNRIRKVTVSTGIITTVGGNGVLGFGGDGGTATAANFAKPYDVAFDASGNLYVADLYNNRIRKILGSSGIVSTIAGNGTTTVGSLGDGCQATSAVLNITRGSAVDGYGNLYIVDQFSNRIKKRTASTGIITTVAGNGNVGYFGDGSQATSATLSSPICTAVDANGNVYFTDQVNQRIRKLTIATGVISTVAGNGQSGYNGDGIQAVTASLAYPTAIALDASGNLYIADADNNRIRKVTASTGIITTVAGNQSPAFGQDGILATSSSLSNPQGVAVDAAGNIYIGDNYSYRIRKVSASTGIITTVVGNGTSGFSGDGGLATAAQISIGYRIVLDASGNIYLSDKYNIRVRKVNAATGIITTVVGNGSAGYTGDGGLAINAGISSPEDISIDALGNLYITDNNVIRKVTVAGTTPIITSFTPTTAATGTTVTIKGYNFTNTSTVSFGCSVAANSFTVVNDTVITAVVGYGASGSVAVTNSAGVGSLAGFTFLPAPTITSFTPSIGCSGTAVTINGTNFTGATAVSFGGANASSFTVNSATSITAIVGSGATGSVKVTTPGGAVSSSSNYVYSGGFDAIAYVANYNSNSVSIINTTTNSVTSTIGVGSKPFGVCVTPDGSYVYVTNSGSNNVSVINVKTNTVVSNVVVGTSPFGISVSPDGTRVYVANYGSHTVSVLNTATNTVIATIGGFNFPEGLIFSTDGTKVYVANTGNYSVSVINTATNSISATISVGGNPAGLGISPDGKTLYVSNWYSNTLSVINTSYNTVTATVSVGNNPYGICVSPDGTKVYLANEGSNNVHVINSATNTITNTINVGSSPRGVSINFDGTKVFVANKTSNTLSIINTANNTVSATIGIANSPSSLGNFISNVFSTCILSPTITSFTPTTAPTGTTITIKGSSFTNATAVSFGGSAANSFTVVNDTVITAVVGSGASGSVTVTNSAGVGSLAGFVFSNPPNINYAGGAKVFTVGSAITAFSPSNSGGAVTQTVTTVAGSGNAGAVDGAAATASFKNPFALSVDAAGNLYIADADNNKIRKISPSGLVSTLAGSGTQASVDGTGAGASFAAPYGIATDASGNAYVADGAASKIRKITAAGVVSTFAGTGVLGATDGAANIATFNGPFGVAIDAIGNLYIADQWNHKIRKVSPLGVVSTLAGTGSIGAADGAGNTASFNAPYSVAVDASGNVYVADGGNNKIRKITPAGVVSTLAGNGAKGATDGTGTAATFNAPSGVAVDMAGNVYVADLSNHKIRKISPSGVVSTLSGTGTSGAQDGAWTDASFNSPTGIAIDSAGNLYIADATNNKIRRLVQGYSISPNLPTGLKFDATTGTISGTPTIATTATTYTITGFNATGSSSTTLTISTVAVPAITSFTPTTAPTGTTITIKGSSFTNATAVSFGGTAASSFTVVNDSVITSVVGSGASGSVAVTNSAGVGSLAGFKYCMPTSSTSNISICSNALPYTWNGNSYNTSGIYTKTLVNAVGCDSVATLNLTVKSTSSSSTNISVCSNALPYTWNGNSYNTAGTYTKTLVNAAGCDSVATLNLTVKSTSSSTTNISVCSNALPYSWNGNSYNTAGTYNKTLVNAAGCDSVATLNLTVKSTSSSTTNISVCSNALPYSWNGNSYNTSGTYTKTLVNAAGCDSVATLNLTVKSTSSSTTNISVCSNSLPYSWNGNNYNTAGTYTKTLVNAAGCDSVATLNLTVKSTSSSTTNISVCSNSLPYSWNGNSYNTAGTYTKTLVNAVGCDSVATLNLTVKSTSSSTTNISVCSNALPYSWNGNSYNTAGTYTKTLVNTAGCDSVATLNLKVKSTSSSTTNISVCSNVLPYSWNGHSYNTAGTYTKTLVNAAGCDSVATLNLTVKPTSSSTTNISVCSNSLPYSWNGNSYNTAGTYTKTLVNAAGCDSVATLNLTINTPTASTTTVSNCGSYTWNGVTYTSSGTYTKTFTSGNSKGCDSVATLNLTINTPTASTTTVSNCGSYTWNGVTYTSNGTYTKTFTSGNSKSCDSVATLNLTINTPTASTTTVSNCGSYTWNGVTYTYSGTYTKTFTSGNSKGCDSVATLNLTINTPTASTTTVSNCGSYTWNGVTYTSSGTYTKTFTSGNSKGCDSVATLNLTINTPTSSTTTVSNCGSFTWNGVAYTSSGTYTKTFTGGNSKGCDSVATLNLTINTPTASTTTVSNCGSYTWNGVTYTSSGTYTKTFTGGNSKGCDSVATLVLTVNTAVTPSISISTASTVNCAGATVNFTSSISNGGPTPTYQWSKNGISISGATGASYSNNSLVNGDIISCALTSNNNCQTSSTAISNTITLSFQTNPTPVVVTGTGNNYFCSGDSVKLSVKDTVGTGRSLKLNGSNQNMNLGNWFNLQAYTFSFWVKPGATQVAHADMLDNNHADDGINRRSFELEQVGNDLNTYYFYAGTAVKIPDYQNAFTLTPNVWQHIALVVSPNQQLVYVNGNVVSNTVGSGVSMLYDGTQSLSLGSWSLAGSSRYWNGEMDEVRIYNTLLTQSQIQSEMANNVTIAPSNLVAYYTFDGSNGVSASDNYNGTAINGPTYPISTAPINCYTYNWQPINKTTSSVFVKAANSYTVTTTNSLGCTATSAPIAISMKLASASTTNISVCSNALPYSWNGNSYSTAGTYTKTLVNAAGCDSVATLVLSVNTSVTPSISISTASTVNCAGATVNFISSISNGGTTPTYQWRKNGISISGATGASYSNNSLVNGDIISCVLTANNNCQTSSTVTSNIITLLFQTNPTPVVVTVTGNNYFCSGDSLKLSVKDTVGTGRSLKLNGINQSVDIGSWMNYQTFTMSFWMKPAPTQVAHANVIDNNHGVYIGFEMEQYGSNPNDYYYAGHNKPSTPAYFSLSANTWYHIAIVETPTQEVVYLNGVKIFDVAATSLINYSSPYLRIGNWSQGGRNWNGEIDEFRIYNAPLSQSQVLSEMTTNVTALPANLVLYYNFDGSNVTSTTGNYNGTAINGPTYPISTAPINSYTYNWQPINKTTSSVFVKATNTYTVTTTNSLGCAATSAPISISMRLPSASTTNISICSTALPYSWNGNSYSTAGTYTKNLVNAAGCDSVATLVLSVNTSVTPSISISTSSTVNCAGATVNFASSISNGGTTPIYQWRKNGININSATGASYSSNSLVNGDIISCVLTANNSCQTSSTATSNSITLSFQTNPTPIVVTGTGNNYFCSGDSLKLSVKDTVGTGRSLKLNGVNQSVDIGSWMNYQTFTMSFWMKPAPTQVAHANVIDNNHGIYIGFEMEQYGSNPNDYYYAGHNKPSTPAYFSLSANTWYHVAIVETPTQEVVYLNGVKIFDVAATSLINYSSPYLRIGNWSQGGRNWNGEIDEFRIYNAPLSQSQVLSEMTTNVTALPANLVLYYNFDGSNVTSTTGNYNGTAINGPTYPISTAPINSYSYNWQPINKTTSSVFVKATNTYTVTTTNSLGCAATSAPIAINMRMPSASSTTISVFANTLPINWNGSSYNSAGTYTKTLVNAVGCDSIATLILSVKTPTSITSFTPTTASSGNIVTIKGQFFTSATAVSFGGTPASSFSVINDSVITAVVGTGASGNVSVSTPSGTVSLAGFSYCVPSKLKANYNVVVSGKDISVINNSIGATVSHWFFGDGTDSYLQNPYHTYTSGSYILTLVATGNCPNLLDSLKRTVKIAGLRSINTDHGGNQGRVTVQVSGLGFVANMQLLLRRSGQANVASDSLVINKAGNSLKTSFNLSGLALGAWDVVAIFPSGAIDTLKGGFTVESAVANNLSVSIEGSQLLRVGFKQVYSITVANNGNVDASLVPVLVSGLPAGTEILIKDSLYQSDASVATTYTDVNSKTCFRIFSIGNVPAGGTATIHCVFVLPLSIQLHSRANVKIYLGIPSPTAADGSIDYSSINTGIKPLVDSAKTKTGIAATPDCFNVASSKGTLFLKNFQAYMKAGNTNNNLSDMADYLATGNACNGSLTAVQKANYLNYAINHLGRTLKGYTDTTAIYPPPTGVAGFLKTIAVSYLIGNAWDPNSKYGEGDSTNGYYLNNYGPVKYTIGFENLPTATANAAVVTVNDTLNPKYFDYSSFRFTSVSIGDSAYSLEFPSNAFTHDIDFTAQYGVKARVTAFFDTALGAIQWKILSIDPLTNQQTTGTSGFLPPDVVSPKGQGYLNFTIGVNKKIKAGDSVLNQASIVFDNNPPIQTGTWVNYFDFTAPSSGLSTLASMGSYDSIPLKWSGKDDRSGVASYHIYVSIDNESFVPWLLDYTGTNATYIGKPGHKYGFYTIARDNAGNYEPAKTVADEVITLSPVYTWTGAVSNLWSDPANWSYHQTPTASNPVSIPSTVIRQPKLDGAVTIDSLGLDGLLDLNGQLLTVGRILSGSGYLKGSSTSSLTLSGTKESILRFNPVAGDSLLNTLTLNGKGGAQLANGLGITNLLSVNSGNLDITGGNLTLKSTSIANTAVVGVVGGTVTGNVTVERFIPKGNKASRQLCSGGVYNAGSIFQNWQENGNSPVGYGTYVFGKKGTAAGVDATTGLDVTSYGAPSAFIYTNYMTYSPIVNTKNTQIDPYLGYILAVYGDRTKSTFPASVFDASNQMNSATTIRTTGQLVTGTVTYSTTGVTGNYSSNVVKLFPLKDTGTLIANPYAAPIDWHTVTKVNMSNSYWYVDPTFFNAGYQVPVAYNAVSGTNSNLASKIGRYIQPGQSFWPFTDATNNFTRQIVVKESDKAINATKTAVFGASAPVNRIGISLSKGGIILDGAVAVFKNGFNKAYQAEDSKKMFGNGESVFIQEAGRILCIDGLPEPTQNDAIQLGLGSLSKDSTYQLEISTAEFTAPNGIRAYLVDNQLGTQTAINGTTTVSIRYNGSAASIQNRYGILFKTSVPLAVRFVSVKANRQEKAARIEWTVAQAEGVSSYVVEKSTDGGAFKTIGTVKATEAANYGLTEESHIEGKAYYRVKAQAENGKATLSEVALLSVEGMEGITVYPNPAGRNGFNLSLHAVAASTYSLTLRTEEGKIVESRNIKLAEGQSSYVFKTQAPLAAGLYTLSLEGKQGLLNTKVSIK